MNENMISYFARGVQSQPPLCGR